MIEPSMNNWSQHECKCTQCLLHGLSMASTEEEGRQSILLNRLTLLKGPTQQPNAHDAIHAVFHVLHCMHLCQKVHSPVLQTGPPFFLSKALQISYALCGNTFVTTCLGGL